MAIHIGESGFCWGTNPEWSTAPIVNLPADAVRVRRRFRNTDFGRCFIKRASGAIEHWVLKRVEGGLELKYLQGSNASK